MTRSELIEKIEHGDDIMFTVDERGFTIITWPDDGPIIGEWNKEKSEKQYKSAEELVDSFTIGGVRLGNMTGKIQMKSYTQVSE